MSFEETVKECLRQPEFLREYRRLRGVSIGSTRSPIDKMIDDASGREEKEWRDFFDFVRDYIYVPVLLKTL